MQIICNKYYNYITSPKMVGVGYHHPSIQWPNTPMDERQRGNPAAAACQGGLGLLGY